MNNQEERIQTYEGFQDKARSAMKRVMGKKEKQEKPRAVSYTHLTLPTKA